MTATAEEKSRQDASSTKEKPALKIWRYAVPKVKNEAFTVKMPAGAVLWSVQRMQNEVYLWALVNQGMPEEERFFWVAQDNFPIPSPGGVENYEITGLRRVGSYFGFGQVLHLVELEGCKAIPEPEREPGTEG